jgi:uncharacterized surface protein with fasciclin (FAS1) repeats
MMAWEYHLVSGNVLAADLAGQTTAVATVEGDKIDVNSKHGVQVNCAHVVKASRPTMA